MKKQSEKGLFSDDIAAESQELLKKLRLKYGNDKKAVVHIFNILLCCSGEIMMTSINIKELESFASDYHKIIDYFRIEAKKSLSLREVMENMVESMGLGESKNEKK